MYTANVRVKSRWGHVICQYCYGILLAGAKGIISRVSLKSPYCGLKKIMHYSDAGPKGGGPYNNQQCCFFCDAHFVLGDTPQLMDGSKRNLAHVN